MARCMAASRNSPYTRYYLRFILDKIDAVLNIWKVFTCERYQKVLYVLIELLVCLS
jgi:hypothetical protein